MKQFTDKEKNQIKALAKSLGYSVKFSRSTRVAWIENNDLETSSFSIIRVAVQKTVLNRYESDTRVFDTLESALKHAVKILWQGETANQ